MVPHPDQVLEQLERIQKQSGFAKELSILARSLAQEELGHQKIHGVLRREINHLTALPTKNNFSQSC
jgi:hypothetical protein